VTEPTRIPFTTIDDVIQLVGQVNQLENNITQLVKELLMRLTELGERKHPLSVRKGVRQLTQTEETHMLKAGSTTYFFDTYKTGEGKPYLKITESRFKGKGEASERRSINIFPEHAQAFIRKFQEIISRLDLQGEY